MNTYTENEIKEWFEKMKKRYPNSKIWEHLHMVEFMMFNKSYDTKDCLEKIKENTLKIKINML